MPLPSPAFLAPYRALPRPVQVVFLAQIVNRMGDFALPLLTLFLTRKLGMGEAATGALVMAAALSGMAGTLMAGRLCDRLGRKPVLLVFQSTAAVLIGLCGFLPPGPAVPVLLIVAGLFQGAVRPSISAIIIDLTGPHNRKTAFSLSYLGINLGVAIGPMLAGLLFESHLAWIFWIDAITTVGALALVALFVPETHPERAARAGEAVHSAEPANPTEARQEGGALAAWLARPALVAFTFIMLLANFMYAQTHFGLALYSGAVFGADGARWYGLMMSFNAVVVLACTLPLTWLTRRLPILACVALGAVCYTIGFGMLAFALPLPLLAIPTLIWTWGEILFATNTGTWVAHHTPSNQRGRFQAIQGVVQQTGLIASPLVCGQIAAQAGVFASWALVAAVGVAVTAALVALRAKTGD